MNETFKYLEVQASGKLNYDESIFHRDPLPIRMRVTEGSTIELRCPNTNMDSNVVWRKNYETFKKSLKAIMLEIDAEDKKKGKKDKKKKKSKEQKKNEADKKLDEAANDEKFLRKKAKGFLNLRKSKKEKTTQIKNAELTALNVLIIHDIEFQDSARYDCLVDHKIKGIYEVEVKVFNRTRINESHLFPEYHVFLYFYFGACSIIIYAILCIKCIRYRRFLSGLKQKKQFEITFEQRVQKYIQLNYAKILEKLENIQYDSNNIDDNNLEGENDDDYYDHEKEDIIVDKLDRKLKQLRR